MKERQSKLWMDATGASPDCSIVGNTMERGFGHTPMGDHCGNACGFEVVLPTGECIETGFSRFGCIQDWRLEPLGCRAVARRSLLAVQFRHRHPHDRVADAGPRMLRGLLLCLQRQGWPWRDRRRPPPSALERDTSEHHPHRQRLQGINRHDAVTRGWREWKSRRLTDRRWKPCARSWASEPGTVPVASTARSAQVREAKRQLKRALKGKVDRLQFVNDRLLGLMGRFSQPFRLLTGWNVSKTLSLLEPVYNLMKGVPTESTLGSTYWRKRTPPSATPDPDRDRCGLLWCSPVVPSTGNDVRAVTDLATQDPARARLRAADVAVARDRAQRDLRDDDQLRS